MRTLIDTQSFYWSLYDEAGLSRRGREALLDLRRDPILSVAVFWEMTIKNSLGKLSLPTLPHLLWKEVEDSGSARILGIEARHLRRLQTLPPHHGDPFDRLMIAQALEDGLEVISSDSQWDAYGVKRIW